MKFSFMLVMMVVSKKKLIKLFFILLLPKQVTFKENPIICYWFLFQMARVRFEDSMLATAN